jgi:AraC-like DNA-binding protein
LEHQIELINGLGKIIVFLMILFSIFLFTVESNKRLSNQLFAVFLLITAFDLAGLFLADELANYPTVQNLKVSSSLLQMPIFYLYVLSVCFSDFNTKPKYLLHTAPFLLFFVIFSTSNISSRSLLFYRMVGEVQYLTYIVAVFYALKKYRTVYLENYAKPDSSSYKWLLQITLLFCVAHIFVLLKTWAPYLLYDQQFIHNLYVVISLSALFIISWFVLKALYTPHLFSGVKTALSPIASSVPKPILKTAQDKTTKEAIAKLAAFMENEKPYLDCELTLQTLAFQFSMPEKELSILINHYVGKHFFDFINDYRIDEAKTILENPANRTLTILEVLYQVGFNSKSSFYTSFKKVTNQTPTEYRKTALLA